MQEMNQIVCYRAGEGEEGRLEDIRDGKTYWVAKLKDGNCWMTQNLDLDLKTTKTLTSVDSDVEKWTPPEDTQITANPDFGDTNNNIKSWDPAQGEAERYCNNAKCDSINITTIVTTNNTHYAQGNYYSWGAATAGQASSLTSETIGQQSTQSICPKGWRLPFSGDNTANMSFGFLLSKYGLASNTPGTAIDGITYSIDKAPLYFVYGGSVAISSLNNAGENGLYWSSTARSSSQAYYLIFSTSVNPSYYFLRYFGYSVRCVAR